MTYKDFCDELPGRILWSPTLGPPFYGLILVSSGAVFAALVTLRLRWFQNDRLL